MTDTPRCEPPPELRDRDGSHWVKDMRGALLVHEWSAEHNGWRALHELANALAALAPTRVDPIAEIEA